MALLSAALEELTRMRQSGASKDFSLDRERSLKLLGYTYQQRLEMLQRNQNLNAADETLVPDKNIFALLAGQLRRAEREELIRLQTQGQVGDSTLRKLERELDLLDLRWPAS